MQYRLVLSPVLTERFLKFKRFRKLDLRTNCDQTEQLIVIKVVFDSYLMFEKKIFLDKL